MTRSVDLLLWVVAPYLAVTVFALGTAWRYRYDQAGWTTRSSQLLEGRILRLGSPLFHLGILLTVGGHVLGLLVPAGWTRAVGISPALYHHAALILGGFAGLCAVSGLAILGWRRITVRSVARTTTRMDRVTYLLLGITLLLGMAATGLGDLLGEPHDYRQTVAPWLRSLIALQPRPDLMSSAPLWFQLHALTGLALIALWPFTRLVHALTPPLGYLTRPYIVYRTRDSHARRRGPGGRGRRW